MSEQIGELEYSGGWTTAWSPSEDECLTAVAAAVALDTVPGADRRHWAAPAGGRRAARADSPVHTAEMAAPVLLATTAGSRAVVAGNRAVAVAVW